MPTTSDTLRDDLCPTGPLRAVINLGNPVLDWLALAAGMGVEAAKAEDLETLGDLLASSFRKTGPFLIELVI